MVENDPIPGNKLFLLCESQKDCSECDKKLKSCCDKIEKDTGYKVAGLFDYLSDYENPNFYNLPNLPKIEIPIVPMDPKGDLTRLYEKVRKTMCNKCGLVNGCAALAKEDGGSFCFYVNKMLNAPRVDVKDCRFLPEIEIPIPKAEETTWKDKNVREIKGPEAESIFSQLKITKCKHCNTDLPHVIQTYDHTEGWNVNGFEKKQWLYITCPKCHNGWSLWKLGYFQESEKPEIEIVGETAKVADLQKLFGG